MLLQRPVSVVAHGQGEQSPRRRDEAASRRGPERQLYLSNYTRTLLHQYSSLGHYSIICILIYSIIHGESWPDTSRQLIVD